MYVPHVARHFYTCTCTHICIYKYTYAPASTYVYVYVCRLYIQRFFAVLQRLPSLRRRLHHALGPDHAHEPGANPAELSGPADPCGSISRTLKGDLRTYNDMDVCICICIYVRIYVILYISLYMSTSICIYIYTYIHTYLFICLCRYFCVRVCLSSCMSMCTHTCCACMQTCVCIYIYKYTHTCIRFRSDSTSHLGFQV